MRVEPSLEQFLYHEMERSVTAPPSHVTCNSPFRSRKNLSKPALHCMPTMEDIARRCNKAAVKRRASKDLEQVEDMTQK